jgi:glyoxylase-like metal-dependent hydrolase (beta-lactamase superfamily II)
VTADSEPSTFEAAAAAGIHCLPIPTPFLVGRVNCYLIDDEPLTLVDTGPNSGKSLDELEQALAAHGRSVEELELIVLTHQHMDHVGLLEILSRRSGAEVAALAPLAPYLADWGASAAADDEFAQQTMRRHGTPAELATVLGAVGAAFRAFGSGGTVTRRLSEGDELAFRDRTLRVLHRPGHSPSDTLFWDERRRMVLGGDHLLAHISSNPLVTRPLDQAAEDGGARPHALITYLESMEKTRSLELDLVLPGHGEAITDHVSLIDERFRMHERRARKLLRMLEPEPLSAYELALQMWGNIAVTQAFLTISEVLGHLDLLVRDGHVAELERDGVVRFEALG